MDLNTHNICFGWEIRKLISITHFTLSADYDYFLNFHTCGLGAQGKHLIEIFFLSIRIIYIGWEFFPIISYLGDRT